MKPMQNDTRKNVPWRKNELFFLFDEVTLELVSSLSVESVLKTC